MGREARAVKPRKCRSCYARGAMEASSLIAHAAANHPIKVDPWKPKRLSIDEIWAPITTKTAQKKAASRFGLRKIAELLHLR